MSATAFLVFLLPVIAAAEIHIDIQVSDTLYNTAVYMSGESEDLVSDTDRTIFQLRDWEIKEAMHTFSGGRPDDVYLKDPTPWGNLFKIYGWSETKRTVTPVKTKILDHSTETVVVDKSQSQSDMTVRHTWTAGNTYYFRDHVSYNVTLGSGLGKYRSVFYKNWFGFTHSTASGVSIGSDVSVSPRSKYSEEGVLTAKRCVLKVEVAYEATLSGGVLCNFANKFDGHHFWYHSVNMGLEAVGKPTKLLMKETIEVVLYFDEEVAPS